MKTWRRNNYRLDWLLACRRGVRRNVDAATILTGLAGVLLGVVLGLVRILTQ